MSRHKFHEIIINSREHRAPNPGDEKNYITVSHLIPHKLEIPEWGINEPFEDERLVIKPGDVLFINRDPQNHQVAVSPIDGLFTGFGLVLRPITDVIYPDFLRYFITSDTFIGEASRISVGTKYKTANWGELKDLSFDLPEIDTQIKLVSVLKKIEQLISLYDVLESNITESQNSLFYEKVLTGSDTKHFALSELMTLHTDSIYFGSTEHERYVTYEELANKASKRRTKSGGFYGYRLDTGQLAASKQSFHKNGTVLVTVEYNRAIIANQTQVFDVHKDVVSPEFLQYMTSHQDFLNSLEDMDLSVSNWNYTFSKKKIAVPSLSTQQEFLKYIHKAGDSLRHIQKCKEQAYELFQSILCEHIKV